MQQFCTIGYNEQLQWARCDIRHWAGSQCNCPTPPPLPSFPPTVTPTLPYMWAESLVRCYLASLNHFEGWTLATYLAQTDTLQNWIIQLNTSIYNICKARVIPHIEGLNENICREIRFRFQFVCSALSFCHCKRNATNVYITGCCSI